MTESNIQSQPASSTTRCIPIVGIRLIAEKHNAYDVDQLWKASAGYEIRTMRNIKSPDAVQIRRVSDKEAEKFALEAAQEMEKWAEINKPHLTLASFVGHDDLCNELQLMADNSFRIVVSDIWPEESCQYEILPADITLMVRMFRMAEEYAKRVRELQQQRHCVCCPACGETGQWELEVNGPRIYHEGPGGKRSCINPIHEQAVECLVCNKTGIRSIYEDRIEYLHGTDGEYIRHTVTYTNPKSGTDGQKKSPVPLFSI